MEEIKQEDEETLQDTRRFVAVIWERFIKPLRMEELGQFNLRLEKRVNKKVMAMFKKAEDEYNNLMSEKDIIENDKSKIKKVIKELDEKKETLNLTWVKVNNDFRSISSTVLPDMMAKLEPPEGCSFLDGLEVWVAFGGV
ncbi:hypothetical protein HN51_018870 [Arachis hypogaea]